MTGDAPAAPSLAGLRLLIAEDDGLIGAYLEDQLTDAGCEIVAVATSLAQAVDLAARCAIDGAILDINLRGETVYAAAEVLRGRGIPFVFLSGYAPGSLPAPFRGEGVAQKPFELAELAPIIAAWRP